MDSPPVTRFALSIGNNGPERPRQQPLRYADDDAIAMHALMTQAGADGVLLVSPDNDTAALYPELSAAPASLTSLSTQVGALAERVRAAAARGNRTELYLYYSGHGNVEGGEGYVLLEDGYLTRSALTALLKRIGALRNHVIVDACQSCLLVSDRDLGGRRRPESTPPALASPGQLQNTGFVLSSSSARESREWARYEAGVFSHEARSGLRGGADADLDGKITYAELGAFIATANLKLPPHHRPAVLVLAPAQEPYSPILTWPEPAFLALDTDAWGHLYLEGPEGARVMDLHLARHQPAKLWPPAQRPLYLRRADESAEYVILSRDRQEIDYGNSHPCFYHVGKGAESVAFEQLFATPFSYAHVASFEHGLAKRAAEAIDTARPLRDLAWTATAIASTSLVAGLALRLYAQREYDRAAQLNDRCDDQCERDDIGSGRRTGRTLENIAYGVLALGGAVGITAAVLFLVSVQPEPEGTTERPSGSAAAAQVSLGLGSLRIDGRF